MPEWVKTAVTMVIVPMLVGVAAAAVSVRVGVEVAAVERKYLRRDVEHAHNRIDFYHLQGSTEEGADYAANH